MNNPRYEGFGKDGSSYVFMAKTARQDLGDMSVIKLDGITGNIIQANKTKTDIVATRGTFAHEKGVLELFESIDVVSEDGLKAKLTHATVTTKDSVLTSDEPVLVEFSSGTIRSKSMTLRQEVNEVTFVDEVEARLVPPARPQAEKPASASGLFTPTGAPIDIVANRLDINDAAKSAIFTGEVKAVQSESIMSTPELKVVYEGAPLAGRTESAAASGADSGQATSATNKVRRIIAKGPVVMTRETPDVVTSDGAEFDATNDTAILTGNVVLASAEDRRATCQRADLDQRADTALLTGNVVVVQGKNQLTGRRLFLDRKHQRAELTSPLASGAGPGRVTARLYQTKSPDQAARRDKPVDPTIGKGQVLEMGAFKTDPDAPVDIEADRLNVDDASKTAIFRGSVVSTQGNFRMESAELHAFYTGGGGLADVSSQAGKAKEQTELTRVEAKRDVVVTSRDGRTVTGDWATFDAKANTVTVGGDVVLSEKQNVVRGTRLVIDMVSGRSMIDTAPAQAVALPAGGGWAAKASEDTVPENRGRPSAVFYPNKVKDAPQGKAASNTPNSPSIPAKPDGAATGSGN
jgi:lipopolysaccharide transport protein LptA